MRWAAGSPLPPEAAKRVTSLPSRSANELYSIAQLLSYIHPRVWWESGLERQRAGVESGKEREARTAG